jgi:hypothetical protein
MKVEKAKIDDVKVMHKLVNQFAGKEIGRAHV